MACIWLVLNIVILSCLRLTSAEMNLEPQLDDNENRGRTRFVKRLDEESYQQFINSTNVEIVYFQKKDSRRMQSFLREYENSAERLFAFGISLGLVHCQHHLIKDYCEDERSLQYAFGFRNGEEKIALPLDTLFDFDSIVASALHLSLIHNVPIVQTLSERKALEMKCKGRYNIVFSYQKALGTYEHRIFMEVAYTFLDAYVFAMTISETAVQDLRHFNEETMTSIEDFDRHAHIDPTVWVLHCQSVTDHKEPCTQIFFYGQFLYLDVFHFVKSLDAPQWIEFPNQKMEEMVPYNLSEIHLLYVVMNDEDHRIDNLISTYKHLGQMFAGSVGLIFVHLNNASDEGLLKLGLPTRDEIKSKSNLVWKWKGKDTLLWKRECDDLLHFILGNLRNDAIGYSEKEIKPLGSSAEHHLLREENYDEHFDALSELHQDDMVAEFVRLSNPIECRLQPLTDIDYWDRLNNEPIALQLFYVDWDPNCQVTIQILNEIQQQLDKNNVTKPFLSKVNCFDWPKLCEVNNITIYPTIKISLNKNNRSYIYQNLIERKSILAALKLLEFPNPLLLKTLEEALNFTKGEYPFVFPLPTKPSFVILIGLSSLHSQKGEMLVNKLAEWVMGTSIIGCSEGKLAQEIGRHFNIEPPFLIQCNLNDAFKPITIHDQEHLENLNHLKLQIKKHQLESFGELTLNNFPLYRQHAENDLVIYFKPHESINDDDPAWRGLVRKVATSGKYPHLLFTWMKTNDSLAQSLMSFYKIKYVSPSAVRIFFQTGVYSTVQTKEFDHPELFERWLDAKPNVEIQTENLLPGDWKPLHPGFDYLRLIDEDARTLGEGDPMAMQMLASNVDLQVDDKEQYDTEKRENDSKESKHLLRVSYTNAERVEEDKWNDEAPNNQKVTRNEF